MQMDDRSTQPQGSAAPQSRRSRTVRSVTFTVAALTLCLVSALAATGLARMLRPAQPPLEPVPNEQKPQAARLPASLFRNWKKPDLALVVSAQQHGYLLPCGCSRPQKGGLERRYNFLQRLKEINWPIAAVDLGDIPQRHGAKDLPNVQGKLKYLYSMHALREMRYLAVGLGEYESALSLFDILGEYALNNPAPRVVVANIADAESKFPEQTRPWEIYEVAGTNLRVGVTSIIGKSVQSKMLDPNLKFADNRTILKRVLQEMADAPKKADLRVLLLQGSKEEAELCARDFPAFNVIVCLSAEDEPSSEPKRIDDRIIVATGHKGRYIGVVGVYRTGERAKPVELKYQLVSLDEDFLTAPGEVANHPVLKLMEQYTAQLKKDDYLGKYGAGKHPLQLAVPGDVPVYVGSEKCKKCHDSAFEVWKNSKHAHAYQTLVDVKQPSNRQYDAECIVCHTVGFGYESGFRNERNTPKLKDVGCESCHGPGSKHVADWNNEKWQALMNPWKPKENETAREKTERMHRVDKFCQGCHDIDNDVHYKFEERWPKVAHPTGK